MNLLTRRIALQPAQTFLITDPAARILYRRRANASYVRNRRTCFRASDKIQLPRPLSIIVTPRHHITSGLKQRSN